VAFDARNVQREELPISEVTVAPFLQAIVSTPSRKTSTPAVSGAAR
jgi:hypothetical protein